MFIHLPNTNKPRATGSPLPPGARGGRCSEIINNVCFSSFPLKFQGLLAPLPNSSVQPQPAPPYPGAEPLIFLCCQIQVTLPQKGDPRLTCFHPKKPAPVAPASPRSWGSREGPHFHTFPVTPGERSKISMANWHCRCSTHIKTASVLKRGLSLGPHIPLA